MVSYCICLPDKALSPLSTLRSSCHMFEQNWTCFVPHKCSEYSFWAECCKWRDEASKICSDMLVKRTHEGQFADLGRVNLHLPFLLLFWGSISQTGGNGPLSKSKSKVADDRQQKFSIIASSRFLAHVIDWVFCETQKAWTEPKVKPTLLMVYWKHSQVLEIYPNINSYHLWKSQTNQYALGTKCLPFS